MIKRTITHNGEAADSIPYLNRIFMLLRFVAECGETGARVPEISQHIGIHRVSVYRILKSLLELGYLEQAPDLSYHLGFEAWWLGVAATQRFIPARILAALKRISEKTEESVFLMRRAGNEGVCIGLNEGTFPVRSFVMRIGVRRHLGVGGTSMAILGALPPAEAEQIIEGNATEYRSFGLTKNKVRRLVSEARERGYAYSAGVVAPESRTIAVPLPLSTNTSAMMSISVVTLHSRLLHPRRAKIVQLLKREAADLCCSSS